MFGKLRLIRTLQVSKIGEPNWLQHFVLQGQYETLLTDRHWGPSTLTSLVYSKYLSMDHFDGP